MNDGKLKSRPLANSDMSLDEFLGAAGTQTKEAEKVQPDWWDAEKGREQPSEPETGTESKPLEPEPYPWEELGVREDVTKVFNLRLTEPYFLKLKYIAESTPDSMQKFCLDILLPAIDAKIEELKK